MRLYIYLFILCLSLPVQSQERLLLVLGDSISAGYGIKLEAGWVSLLEKRLAEQGYPYRVKNASISGDTTAGAAARLPSLLADNRPKVSIVELGGNDGLRGLSLEKMAANLEKIILRLKQAGSRVLLVPMRLPPNYGPVFNRQFEGIYQSVANEQDISLSTFILHDVAEHGELMQSDGIHPKASAQSQMLDNIWDDLMALLRKDELK